jgi:hypothetical protein
MKATLNDVLVRAMTDKALLKGLLAGGKKRKAALKEAKLSLSAADLRALEYVPPQKDPIPLPGPPGWEPVYSIASEVLASLNERLGKLEQTMKTSKGRGSSVKR